MVITETGGMEVLGWTMLVSLYKLHLVTTTHLRLSIWLSLQIVLSPLAHAWNQAHEYEPQWGWRNDFLTTTAGFLATPILRNCAYHKWLDATTITYVLYYFLAGFFWVATELAENTDVPHEFAVGLL